MWSRKDNETLCTEKKKLLKENKLHQNQLLECEEELNKMIELESRLAQTEALTQDDDQLYENRSGNEIHADNWMIFHVSIDHSGTYHMLHRICYIHHMHIICCIHLMHTICSILNDSI